MFALRANEDKQTNYLNIKNSPVPNLSSKLMPTRTSSITVNPNTPTAVTQNHQKQQPISLSQSSKIPNTVIAVFGLGLGGLSKSYHQKDTILCKQAQR